MFMVFKLWFLRHKDTNYQKNPCAQFVQKRVANIPISLQSLISQPLFLFINRTCERSLFLISQTYSTLRKGSLSLCATNRIMSASIHPAIRPAWFIPLI